MFLVRRVFKAKARKVWEAASVINEMGIEYEKSGQRNESRIYVNAGTTPGEYGSIYMEWTAEVLESAYRGDNEIPSRIKDELGPMLRELVESQSIEFYELFTPDKKVFLQGGN